MRRIDVHRLADEAPFGRFHLGVLCWCALIIIFDGYDLAVVGIALTASGLRSMQSRLAFGTFLAVAAMLASLAGDATLSWYFSLFP